MTYFIWERGEDKRLSKNFKTSEFECQCGVCINQKISKKLISKLQKMRDKNFGQPIIISSGNRCQAHQEDLIKKKKATVQKSQHVKGDAADIVTPKNDKDAFDLLKLLQTFFKAVGIGMTFYHVDTRDDRKRVWYY